MRVFYEEAFGFRPVGEELSWRDRAEVDMLMGLEQSAARTVMLSAGSCYLELFEFSSPAARQERALRACDHGYTHFCVDVTNIEDEIPRLAAAGMTFPRKTPGDMGTLKFIYGQDPDGNIIEIQELVANSPFALDKLSHVPTGISRSALKRTSPSVGASRRSGPV
jgi:catechol 2,3-dioxygenase-like lactoylglutathione lyase family enzyme